MKNEMKKCKLVPSLFRRFALSYYSTDLIEL